jgi:hypothetical protein
LVTVLVTLAVPDTADADDAATLVAVAADSTALTVIHTTGVEGHLPLPGTTVLRGRQQRPWLVHSVSADTAILTDLAGGVIQVAFTSLHPETPSTSPPTPPPLPPPTPTDLAPRGSASPVTTHPAPTPSKGAATPAPRGHWWSPRPPLP